MDTMQELITTIRALRKELGVPEKESTPIHLHAGARVLALTGAHADMLARLARVSAIEFSTEPLTGNNARSTPSFDVAVIYERQIDVPAERERLTKDLAKYEKILTAERRTPRQRSLHRPKPPPTSSKACASKPQKPASSTTKPKPPSTPSHRNSHPFPVVILAQPESLYPIASPPQIRGAFDIR